MKIMEAIKTITLNNVILQKNGVLRDEKGRLIARLVDKVKFDDYEKSLDDSNPYMDIIEECAKIAELYEPDEKLDYVTYASREIRRRMK